MWGRSRWRRARPCKRPRFHCILVGGYSTYETLEQVAVESTTRKRVLFVLQLGQVVTLCQDIEPENHDDSIHRFHKTDCCTYSLKPGRLHWVITSSASCCGSSKFQVCMTSLGHDWRSRSATYDICTQTSNDYQEVENHKERQYSTKFHTYVSMR